MSFFGPMFPRFAERELAPFFRLLDDSVTNSFARQANFPALQQHMRTFNPRFDVKETSEAYELHGELPGVDQKDLEIEFLDHNTLQIKGRTERTVERGSPPSALLVGGQQAKQISYQKPTVEEDKPDTSAAAAAASESTKPAEDDTTHEVVRSDQPQGEVDGAGGRYWVSERSVGSFQRSFTFPGRVNQEAVKASLKNSILSIVVPKATHPESRKINLQTSE